MTRYVYDLNEGRSEDRQLLGEKGADLAEMVRLGLPVPPGFTITIQACQDYVQTGAWPAVLDRAVTRQLARLEQQARRRLGDPDDPLLVSIRPGAAFPMPETMRTVLNVGLNDRSVQGLAHRLDGARPAFDCYRRLIHTFGETVMGVPGARYLEELAALRARRGMTADAELTSEDLRDLCERFMHLTEAVSGTPFPQSPREQLDRAVRAGFESVNSERARIYCRQHGLPNDVGTAINVQAMVFGNRGPASGCGVAFTRDPQTGELGPHGVYVPSAQGEDVEVAAADGAVQLSELRRVDERAFLRLRSIMGTLERRYRDLCEIAFTVEEGRLWVLETRIGRRSAEAAFRIAVELVDEGTIDLEEALSRVTGDQLAQLLHPGSDVARWVDGESVDSELVDAVARLVDHADELVRRAGVIPSGTLGQRDLDHEPIARLEAGRAVLRRAPEAEGLVSATG